MTHTQTLCVAFLACLMISQPAIGFAQASSQEQDQSRWWANLCTGEISLNLKQSSLWLARYSLLPFTISIESRERVSYSDFGLLMGDEWSTRWWSASAAAGLAFTRVKKETGTRVDGPNKYPILTEFKTAGIAFETQAASTPFSFLGVGLGYFGNLNPKKSFSGFVLTVRFGSF